MMSFVKTTTKKKNVTLLNADNRIIRRGRSILLVWILGISIYYCCVVCNISTSTIINKVEQKKDVEFENTHHTHVPVVRTSDTQNQNSRKLYNDDWGWVQTVFDIGGREIDDDDDDDDNDDYDYEYSYDDDDDDDDDDNKDDDDDDDFDLTECLEWIEEEDLKQEEEKEHDDDDDDEDDDEWVIRCKEEVIFTTTTTNTSLSPSFSPTTKPTTKLTTKPSTEPTVKPKPLSLDDEGESYDDEEAEDDIVIPPHIVDIETPSEVEEDEADVFIILNLPAFFVQIQTSQQEGTLDQSEILDKTERYLTFRYMRDIDPKIITMKEIDLKIVSTSKNHSPSTPQEPNHNRRKLLSHHRRRRESTHRKLMLSTVTFEGEAHFMKQEEEDSLTSLPSIQSSMREITEQAFTDFESKEGIQLLVSLYKSSHDPVLSSVETLYVDFVNDETINTSQQPNNNNNIVLVVDQAQSQDPPPSSTSSSTAAISTMIVVFASTGTISGIMIFLIGAYYCIIHKKKVVKKKEAENKELTKSVKKGSKYNFNTFSDEETAFSPHSSLPHPSEFINSYNSGDTITSSNDIGSDLVLRHYKEGNHKSFGVNDDDTYSIASSAVQSYAYSMSYPPSVLFSGHSALGEPNDYDKKDESFTSSVAEISLDESRFNSIMLQQQQKCDDNLYNTISSVWKKAQTPTTINSSLTILQNKKKENKTIQVQAGDDGISILSSEDLDDNFSYNMGSSDLMMSEY